MCEYEKNADPLTRIATGLLLGGLVALSACDAGPTLPSHVAESPEASLSTMPVHQQLALHVSTALRDEGARKRVLRAMRASPLVDHKLELQRFLGSPAGAGVRDLVSAAAAEAGGDLDVLLEQVPPLDFYVPREEDRMSWRGSDDVLVYSYLDDGGEALRGFRVQDGRRVEVTGDLSSTFVALHPAEGKHLRIGAQAAGPGDVIQEPGDGTLAGSVTLAVDGDVLYRSDLARVDGTEFRAAVRAALERTRRTRDAADTESGPKVAALESCDGTTAILECDTGGGGGGSYAGVILNSVGVTFCDNLSTWETNEIEFRSNAAGMDYTARVEGVPCNSPGDFPFLAVEPTSEVLFPLDPSFSGLQIDSEIWETDGFLNGDDFAGGFNPDATATPQGIEAFPDDDHVQAEMGGWPPTLDVDHVFIQSSGGLPSVGLTGLVTYSVVD